VSLNLPTYLDIVNRSRSDISKRLPNLDPTIFTSFIGALSDSISGRHYDNTLSISQLNDELFPQSAKTNDSLDRWAEYENLTRFQLTQSTGNLVITGTLSTLIPSDTELKTDDGNLFTTDIDATIGTSVVSVSSLTRSGFTVTATTTANHGFASNIAVVIAGANETDYNGTFTITVLSLTTFIYTITTSPTTPATGTITATCTCTSVGVTSTGFGSAQNLDSGAKLTLTSPVTGVDSEGYMDFNGATGGQDVETNAALLVRILQARSNPVSNFNIAAIEKVCLAIQGVTRVWVQPITPSIGQVTTYFVRDNDDNIIPDTAEVAEVRSAISVLLPATSDPDDVFVIAPTAISTTYTFTSISPNTATMQNAIIENLSAFYEDEVTLETNILEDKYRAAITNTIDPITGDTLLSFVLASPSGDITVASGELGTLNEVLFT